VLVCGVSEIANNVVRIDELAQRCDDLSIGSNDLTRLVADGDTTAMRQR